MHIYIYIQICVGIDKYLGNKYIGIRLVRYIDA